MRQVMMPNGKIKTYDDDVSDDVIKNDINIIKQQGDTNTFANSKINETQTTKEEPTLSTDVLGTLSASGGKFISDLITPFTQPIQTAKSIGALASSVVNNIRPGEQGNEEIAKQVGQYFVDRYGSLENIKSTVNKDPVGAFADLTTVLSIPFTGGAGLAARTTGTGSKISKITQGAKKAVDTVDPANLAFRATGAAVSSVAKPIVGMTSGVGKDVIGLAYQAGKSNDAKVRQDFIKNLQGKEDVTLIVDDVQKALEGFKENKQSTFNIAKNKLNLDKRQIDLSSLTDDINKIEDSFTTLGKLELEETDVNLLNKIKKKVREYQTDPNLQNALGADSLKRSIDNLYPNTLTKGRKADIIVTRARNAVKNLISKKVKNYDKVMKKYEEATNLQNQIVKELSTGNANKSTILRKLKSVFSDAGEARFASRGELLDTLEDYNPNISTRLAGQALNPITPKGLQALIASGGVGMSLAGGLSNPKLLAYLLSASPRTVGNISYGAGDISRRMSTPVAGNLTGKDLVAELLRQNRLYQATQGQ